MTISICREFNCPHFNEGRKMDGILIGYGCKKYASSYNCPIAELKAIRPNQYELFADDLNGNQERLIRLAIGDFATEIEEFEVEQCN